MVPAAAAVLEAAAPEAAGAGAFALAVGAAAPVEAVPVPVPVPVGADDGGGVAAVEPAGGETAPEAAAAAAAAGLVATSGAGVLGTIVCACVRVNAWSVIARMNAHSIRDENGAEDEVGGAGAITCSGNAPCNSGVGATVELTGRAGAFETVFVAVDGGVSVLVASPLDSAGAGAIPIAPSPPSAKFLTSDESGVGSFNLSSILCTAVAGALSRSRSSIALL